MIGDTTEIERLRAVGVTSAETVGEILDGNGQKPRSVEPFCPARLGEPLPPLPKPGIYFGMSDEVYHALPCLSNHGIKYLAASPMLFWARTPWLNPKKAEKEAERAAEEKPHHTFGKAYHCRIMEGKAEFERRFVVGLDPADYPDALVHSDQIKAAIMRHNCQQPVKPCSARKDDLIAQLYILEKQAGVEPREAATMKVDEIKAAIREFTETVPVKPVSKVLDVMPDTNEEYMRTAVKADWIAQLLELEPDAKIFDVIEAQHIAEHDGKTFLTFEQFEELEVAALMVERDPEVRNAFKGGYAEVTLIWVDPDTGVLMKARVDYLKVRAMVDLKTVSNQRDRSIENAIRYEIANYKYNMQPAVYEQGINEVKKLIRETIAKDWELSDVVQTCWEGEVDPTIDNEENRDWNRRHEEHLAFAKKWASHRGEIGWLWVFQQKGDAPITRGVRYPFGGTTHMVTKEIMRSTIAKFRKFSETFGVSPWLDVKPIYDIADEDIPPSATDF